MAKYMKFTVGNAADGYKTVEISIDGANSVTCNILRSGLLDVDRKNFPAAKISDAQLAELDALNIFGWEENYSSGKRDGVQWSLSFADGEEIYRGRGANAYPECWAQFLDWLDALVPELEFVDRGRAECVTLEYRSERLTLDRRSKTVTLDKKNSVHIYDAGADTKKLFDTCQKLLDGLAAQNSDDADDELSPAISSTRVKIEVIRHDGAAKNFETLYNENFLPELTNFLEELHALMDDLTAEIFSPVPTEIAPRQGKYILCKVQFKGSYKRYTYSTDDETLSVGDVVDVPVGKYNDVTQARIADIGYFDDYELPFSLDRIKKIIGKHIGADWENY